MSHTPPPFDWHERLPSDTGPTILADPRRRIRLLAVGFALAAVAVLARFVALEVLPGAEFRSGLYADRVETEIVPAPRGAILARDGAVLAEDRQLDAVAVHYRWLEEPVNETWLRAEAKKLLAQVKHRDGRKLSESVEALRGQRARLHDHLASLSRVSADDWNRRRRAVQHRVERMAAGVNRRRRQTHLADSRPRADHDNSWSALLGDALLALFEPPAELPPTEIAIREELEYHILAEGVSAEVVSLIKQRPEDFPGVRLEKVTRRVYPHGPSAAQLIGYVSAEDAADLRDTNATGSDQPAISGAAGVERACEEILRGTPGIQARRFDHRGELLETTPAEQAAAGDDVALTLDLALQQTSERLLDRAIRRTARGAKTPPIHGGAVVVMDIHNGELLALASAPRFEPTLFAAGDSHYITTLLSDSRSPLLNRAVQMAIPPGSLFKVVSAAAILESDAIDPQAPFSCQGYLRHPSAQRCLLFRRFGVGHGPVTLADAMAQSCNVYFYHHASRLGPRPLLHAAGRFGVGRPTGVDLPGESAGNLPTPEKSKQRGRPWKSADTEAVAIGQGRLTMTPLQVARLMGAVANGGRLVTPHVVKRPAPQLPASPSTLSTRPESLESLRAALLQVTTNERGTASAAFRDTRIKVAGKTGTAQTAIEDADHAWFAGYAPADKPRYAFAVVLEHGGSGGSVAAPIAAQLIEQMDRLELFTH